MLNNFEKCVTYVIKSEGEEYTNHPRDPGGPTKFGITLQDVRLYIKKNATAKDVRNLKKETAIWIYKEKYWDVLSCDDLPTGLDYTIFDYGVNSGIGRAGKVLRALVGLSTDTWKITPEVLIRVDKADAVVLIKKVNDQRLAFLKRLNTWDAFGRGWGRRVKSVRAISIKMNNPAAAASFSLRWLRPAFGPGKGMNLVGRQSEFGFKPMLAFALVGGLIAIRNRKVLE